MNPSEKHTLEIDSVELSFGDRRILSGVYLAVETGGVSAVLGRNGCGKSSLLKLLTGAPVPHSGTVSVGSGLVISYVPQDASHLQGLLSDYAREHRLDESLFKAILRKLDFERVMFEKDIRDFSGGQKKKVLLAGSLCERAHLYIWDEPLNYIDVYSRMQLENLIRAFGPTMLFVEHDAAFLEATATKTVRL